MSVHEAIVRVFREQAPLDLTFECAEDDNWEDVVQNGLPKKLGIDAVPAETLYKEFTALYALGVITRDHSRREYVGGQTRYVVQYCLNADRTKVDRVLSQR